MTHRKVLETVAMHLKCIDSLFYFRKDAFFVDLFVRMSNNVAVDMYKQLGYVIYRRVLEYYSGDPDEDAYGKRHFSISMVVYSRSLVLIRVPSLLSRGKCCPADDSRGIQKISTFFYSLHLKIKKSK